MALQLSILSPLQPSCASNLSIPFLITLSVKSTENCHGDIFNILQPLGNFFFLLLFHSTGYTVVRKISNVSQVFFYNFPFLRFFFTLLHSPIPLSLQHSQTRRVLKYSSLRRETKHLLLAFRRRDIVFRPQARVFVRGRFAAVCACNAVRWLNNEHCVIPVTCVASITSRFQRYHSLFLSFPLFPPSLSLFLFTQISVVVGECIANRPRENSWKSLRRETSMIGSDSDSIGKSESSWRFLMTFSLLLTLGYPDVTWIEIIVDFLCTSPFYSVIECKILTLQFHDSGMSNLKANWFPESEKIAFLSLFLSHIML